MDFASCPLGKCNGTGYYTKEYGTHFFRARNGKQIPRVKKLVVECECGIAQTQKDATKK